MKRALAAALLACASLPAAAGRPLSTEDASVLEEKRCQVEAWIDRSRDSTTAWLAPACNFGANIEWQIGGAESREGGASRFAEAYAQAKTVFKEVDDDSPWGVGLVVGVAHRLNRESHSEWEHPYVLVPVSFALGDALLHANVGWVRDGFDNRNITAWAVAVEAPPLGRFTPLAEAFGENSERPFVRAGVRFSLVKDEVDLDLTVVARPGGTRDERFISLGVFWQSGRWLP